MTVYSESAPTNATGTITYSRHPHGTSESAYRLYTDLERHQNYMRDLDRFVRENNSEEAYKKWKGISVLEEPSK